jgi:hypothetical protein
MATVVSAPPGERNGNHSDVTLLGGKLRHLYHERRYSDATYGIVQRSHQS